MKKIKIILADDHRIFRDGIKYFLENDHMQVIAEASSGIELLEILKTKKTDIVIIDITMPGLSGIEVSKQITALHPEIKIMILSMHTEEEFIFNAVKAGAKAYLPKETSKEELLEAVNVLMDGGEYYSKLLSDKFLKGFVKKVKAEQTLLENESLTTREIEILKLSASGKSNKEIADKLSISIKTVDAHKNHFMQKLKLKNTAELVLFALRNNIIEL